MGKILCNVRQCYIMCYFTFISSCLRCSFSLCSSITLTPFLDYTTILSFVIFFSFSLPIFLHFLLSFKELTVGLSEDASLCWHFSCKNVTLLPPLLSNTNAFTKYHTLKLLAFMSRKPVLLNIWVCFYLFVRQFPFHEVDDPLEKKSTRERVNARLFILYCHLFLLLFSFLLEYAAYIHAFIRSM